MLTPGTVDHALCLRLTGFVSLLRENDFSVGVDDATLLVEVATRIGVLDRDLLHWSDRKSTRLNSSHLRESRLPSSA